MVPKAFSYKPLGFEGDCIRILTIKRGRDDSDDLVCSLEHFPLASIHKTPYAALSYTWGNAHELRTIECEGAALKITENLHDALQHLRSSKHRYFWIDQICINQRDLEERNKQVQLMSKIYSSAESVLIWLNAREGGEYKHYHHIRKIEATSLTGTNNTAQKPYGRKEYLPLLSNSYWSRIWVMQEILLSKETSILLDNGEVDWEDFWWQIGRETTSLLGFPDQLYPDSQRAVEFYCITTSSRQSSV